jgi:hypothetical protein
MGLAEVVNIRADNTMVKRLKEYLKPKQTTNNGTENTIQKNKD